MSMRKLDYDWMADKSWFHLDESGEFVVNDDAPEEAKKSYAHYLEQCAQIAANINAGKYAE